MVGDDMGFRNVYVIHKIDMRAAAGGYRHQRIVGIFEAEGLAEMARKELVDNKTDDDYDAGVYFSVTVYELGKVYDV